MFCDFFPSKPKQRFIYTAFQKKVLEKYVGLSLSDQEMFRFVSLCLIQLRVITTTKFNSCAHMCSCMHVHTPV